MVDLGNIDVGLGSEFIGETLTGDEKLPFFLNDGQSDDVDYPFLSYGFLSPNEVNQWLPVPFQISEYGTNEIKGVGEFRTIRDNVNKAYFVLATEGEINQAGFDGFVAGANGGGLNQLFDAVSDSFFRSTSKEEDGGVFNNLLYVFDDIVEYFKEKWNELVEKIKDYVEQYWILIIILIIIIAILIFINTTSSGLQILEKIKTLK